MGSFNFNNKLQMQIEGKSYAVDVSSMKVLDAQRELVNELLSIKDAADQERFLENTEKVKSISSNYIKAILGEEAYAEIFKGRLIDYTDVVDLANYISNSIREFKVAKMTKYADTE